VLDLDAASAFDAALVSGGLPLICGEWRITDPYLRFWLRFCEPHMAEIERRRGDITLGRIRSGWGAYRGRAIEPLVREALARLLPDEQLPAAPVVGGYWTRTNEVEIDLVGAGRSPVATSLIFVGSIKWHDRTAFDRHDEAILMRQRAQLTGDPVPVVAVSRSGIDSPAVDARYGPDDLIKAWRLTGGPA
jgi:uncharacterized protein